jgi:methionyl-tRNA synthetase
MQLQNPLRWSRLARVLITSALPYANNELHIGHFRSTYIAADIYARFHRAIGDQVAFVCGTDEHGTPISLRSVIEGIPPIELTTKYYELDKQVFELAHISFDYFGRTTSSTHTTTTQWFFLELFKNGYIETKKTIQPYCETDKRYLPDRYVKGTCRYCGYQNARGDECENCGRVLLETDLLNPLCAICGKPTVPRQTENWYLTLNKFHSKLETWIKNNADLFPLYGREYLLNQFLAGELSSFGITRDLDWGVPVPLSNASGKVLYVWFDAPIGYVSFTKELCEKIGTDWQSYWKDPNTKIVHFIGKNIIYHHSLFWPSMLLGVDLNLPTFIVASGLLTLEGKKMSKSSGWGINARRFLTEFESDYLRYYLIEAAPLQEDLDFKFRDFQNKINADLVDTLGNFVHRTLHFIYSKFNGKIPTPKEFNSEDNELLGLIEQTKKKVSSSIEKFEFREGLDGVISLARAGNRYLTKSAPWNLVKNDVGRAATVLYVAASVVKALSVLTGPYLPKFSTKTWELLTQQASNATLSFDQIEKTLAPGSAISEPKPLFTKIGEDKIKRIMSSLDGGEKSQIEIADFSKLDLRVAQVLSAERVSNTKKLLKIKVKMGEQIKTIVSGIGDQYKPEELVNKKIVVLNNLKPSEFAGIVSGGMLLAAEQDGVVSLLTTMRDVADGSPIH